MTFWHLKDLGWILIIKDIYSYCWEKQVSCSVFQPQLSCGRVGLGPGTLPHKRQRAHTASTQPVPGASPCVGISFLVSGAESTLLSLLKVCAEYGTCPAPLLQLSSEGMGQGSFHCGVRGVRGGQFPCVAHRERDILVMGDWHPLLKLILLSFFSMWV